MITNTIHKVLNATIFLHNAQITIELYILILISYIVNVYFFFNNIYLYYIYIYDMQEKKK